MDTATDERVDLDVDLDAELPCEAKSGCDRVGDWVAVNVPCGHRGVPLCDPHKRQDDRTFERARASGHTLICNACKGVVSGARWVPL
jgi:hypothetical protein